VRSRTKTGKCDPNWTRKYNPRSLNPTFKILLSDSVSGSNLIADRKNERCALSWSLLSGISFESVYGAAICSLPALGPRRRIAEHPVVVLGTMYVTPLLNVVQPRRVVEWRGKIHPEVITPALRSRIASKDLQGPPAARKVPIPETSPSQPI